jgi:hypothetical protein
MHQCINASMAPGDQSIHIFRFGSSTRSTELCGFVRRRARVDSVR